MLAVRADERSAAAAGINVVLVKLIGFAIAAFIAGLGGSLLAYQLGNVTFQDFDAYLGLVTFSVVVVAGITSVSGGILAGVISSGGILVALISSGVGERWRRQLVRGRRRHRRDPHGDLQPRRHRRADPPRPGATAGARRHGPTRRCARAVTAVGVRDTRFRAGPGGSPTVAGGCGRRGRGASNRRGEEQAVPAPVLAPVSAEAGELVGSGAGVGSNGHTHAQAQGNGQAGPLLDVKNLTVRYGGVVAVDDVSFSVEEGQIVGLIGPNGAGKTTTIDALCGFHGYTGSVVLAGRDVVGYSPHRRAVLGLARTFQLAGVADDLTVEENVHVGQHMATTHDPAALTRILEELGLVEMRDLQVSMLSQGQRQLVSVARALAGEPRLLLLDEPAAGLDSTESLWLAERLRGVRDTGVTILLVDHDMSLVLNLCDSIDVLDFGALIATGTPDEIRTNPQVSTAYLGATHQRVVAS